MGRGSEDLMRDFWRGPGRVYRLLRAIGWEFGTSREISVGDKRIGSGGDAAQRQCLSADFTDLSVSALLLLIVPVCDPNDPGKVPFLVML